MTKFNVLTIATAAAISLSAVTAFAADATPATPATPASTHEGSQQVENGKLEDSTTDQKPAASVQTESQTEAKK